ncbi:CotH kinase family protein [Maribacter sp. 2308TA10-17]|uniref:CotH kinase family protein n=1 Tax=Maribacter sp. 2308TA10-17 TaxID=3386276 RepID=UPI0039BCCC71
MLKKRIPQLVSFARYFLLLLSLLIVASCSSDDNAPSDQPNSDEPDAVAEVPLPRFLVNTNGGLIVDEPKIPADFTIIENEQTLYSGNMGIEIRGSSSQQFPKKSYGFETWDAEGNDIDTSLLEMPEEEDWILYAPYSDKSLIRNVLIYDLARDMGLYASRTKFVELEINGQYNGLYVFMEKLKRDSGRIDINKLKEDENEGEDLTGGYIIKIDKSDRDGYTDQNSFNSRYGSSIDETGSPIRFLYDYPKYDDITEAQKTYISSYITDFEDALASETFTDPDTGYASFVDVDSFVDFFILNELSNNVDAFRISTWMHKDKNEKLKMGPIWDFNLAFGNADYCSGGEANVWAYKYNERCPDDFWAVPFWWDRLLEDPAFVARLKERWNALRGSTLSDATILAKVDDYVKTLNDGAAISSNFTKWPVLGTYVWPNKFVGSTYNEETAYLIQWIKDRTLWLDNSIGAL